MHPKLGFSTSILCDFKHFFTAFTGLSPFLTDTIGIVKIKRRTLKTTCRKLPEYRIVTFQHSPGNFIISMPIYTLFNLLDWRNRDELDNYLSVIIQTN